MNNQTVDKIYNEDFHKTIKRIKKEKLKVDAIITDPPYNISRKNNFSTIKRRGIDFGEWDKGFNQKKWIRSAASVVKKGGSIIIFNDWRNLGEIAQSLENNGFEVKDIIRWKKSNPMPRNTERRYVTDFEFAIWAVKKGGKWTFNKNKETAYQRPEFKHSVVLGKDKRIHPTQKPMELMEDLINIHTKKDELVFDPFSGSGSTAAAARKTGRHFIASEIDKKYYLESIKRLKKDE